LGPEAAGPAEWFELQRAAQAASGFNIVTTSTKTNQENKTKSTKMSVQLMRFLAALFYGVSSFMITVANKLVLTSYKLVTLLMFIIVTGILIFVKHYILWNVIHVSLFS
jgi:hypothetical protein